MPVSPARAAAFDILLRVETRDSYAAELLHSEACAHLSPADQALTTELVMGVLRWRSALDRAIADISAQKLERLDPEVLTALRIGAYQLGWLDRIPARAAIHESVELVKQARKRSAAPFANAVLRKLADSAFATSFQPALISSAADAGTIAETMAHPEWLVESWCAQFGVDTAQQICAYDQAIPTTALRLRHPGIEAELRAEGIQLAPGAFLSSARRVTSGDVTKTRAYAEGRIAIQDEASQLVAALVGRGKRILDCCAAPGGKTSAIAERNPEATVIAVEVHAHRAELLRKRVRASNVQVIHSDIQDFPVGEPFDRVLVDVPCSGTGTLARNPEIKWRLKSDDLSDLQARQVTILQAAMRHAAEGGRLIYSTCSLQHEEDEQVVETALQANSGFRLGSMEKELEALRTQGELVPQDYSSLLSGPYLRTIPGVHPCDGFFAVLLERIA
jgi:16S rRNA (cytosine967-C5)-methyltransferase